jgi:transcriptional regulator with XRE-family HTH domain
MSENKKTVQRFGDYIETLRKSRCRSLRETAHAIGISPQYYSEVEKGRRSTLTVERMTALTEFLNLSDAETQIMYNKSAEARKHKDVIVPQDFSDYIVERDYTMAALRVAKKLNANEDDWQRFVDDLLERKGVAS